MRIVAGIVAVAFLSACQPAETTVDGAWVRLPAVTGQPGAAYFKVQGGKQADTLVAVSAPFAIRAEMHESMKGDHGMISMAPVEDIPVPAGGAVAFEPGGKHVMLFSVGPNVKPGDTVPVTLAFASGKKIEAPAKVVGAGDPAPK
ncbi:copper chaperone PCu(A)C [Sphingomonas sp. JC676]|uniref:copper chaperone PCu(A)C n=1 Tax=Sphingomonas sp. JC676 TaxID=2768065 RepID=UPI001657D071|nr:copper chaperone PCu(A)C [Sphingomonas sp. JC676]MBC9033508.1 copper chaperone PCu(A)C [Sphingomonas sp. JC676]